MKTVAGRRRGPKPAVSTPIPNWALSLVRNQPVTECVALDGTVIGRGRSQPIKAIRGGYWSQIRQGPLAISISPRRLVCKGDTLTFTMPGDPS